MSSTDRSIINFAVYVNRSRVFHHYPRVFFLSMPLTNNTRMNATEELVLDHFLVGARLRLLSFGYELPS